MLVIRQQPRAAGFTERDQLASESRRTYDDQSINDASRVENQHSKRADGKERAKRLLNHDAEFASLATRLVAFFATFFATFFAEVFATFFAVTSRLSFFPSGPRPVLARIFT